MSDYCLVINVDRCLNCKSCEIACQVNNNLSPEVSRIQIMQNGPKVNHGRLLMDFIPVVCIQCKKRPCIFSCKERAIEEKNGIVFIVEERCTGCRKCLNSCPYGMIFFDKTRKKAEKCDLCMDKKSKMPPYCVANCYGGALMWIPEDEINDDLVKDQNGYGKKVIYISQRRKINNVSGEL